MENVRSRPHFWCSNIVDILVETSAMYGRCWVDIFDRFWWQNNQSLYVAIRHKKYNFIEWVSVYAKQHTDGHNATLCGNMWKRKNDNGINMTGVAIKCNDLNAIKVILKAQKESFSEVYLLDIDDFVWCGNTAIQAAFILCSNNFQMLKYLLQMHKPNYQGFNITQLDESDPYLQWKCDFRTRWDGQEYEHMFIDSLKEPITFKPDCEGLTIDERIEMCQTSNALTNKQCQTLKNILQTRRKACGMMHLQRILM